MMKIVFLGYLTSPETAINSVAGNKMQWNVVGQLANLSDINLSCVSVTPMMSFPHSKIIHHQKTSEMLFSNVKNQRVAFWNLPVLKQFSQSLNVYRAAVKLIRTQGADTLFCFNLFPQIGLPMRWLKKKFPHLNTVCLLADLPFDENPNRKGIAKLLHNRFYRITWRNMQKCDRFVALNANAMKSYLPDKPYIIVDGGIDPTEYVEAPQGWDGKEKNIIYTGALLDYSGIMNLIAAMDLLDDKTIVLDIYGNGLLQSEISQIAAANPRIRYRGLVTNREAMAAQQSAWLLANPRPVHSDIAQVTFPSKIFEYLMSGRPVMTTRLNGFSKDYDDILFWSDGETPEAIAATINHINQIPDNDLTHRAQKARAYMLANKTWSQNAIRIHDYLTTSLGEQNDSFIQKSDCQS